MNANVSIDAENIKEDESAWKKGEGEIISGASASGSHEKNRNLGSVIKQRAG